MSSTSSLLTRIKNKRNGINALALQTPSDAESNSGSDIDDDITIEQCADFINQKYTKNEPRTNVQMSLRHVVAQKNAEPTKNHPFIDMTNSEPLSTEIGNNSKYISNNISNIDDDLLHTSTAVGCVIKNDINSIITLTQEQCNSVSTSPPVKRKRSQLTAEERKAIKEQKEKEKLERQQTRKQEKLEKAMQKELGKVKKKVNTLNNRNERKDECMERMLAVIDSCLIQEHSDGPDILKSLQDVNVQYEVKHLPVASSIGWMREDITYDVGEDSQITKKSKYCEEAHMLHVMSANELACRINKELEKDNEENLTQLISRLRKNYPMKKLSIVITGMEAYHRLVKTKQNQQFRKNVTNVEPKATKSKKKSTMPLLSKKQIDDAIVRIQITTDISVRFQESSLSSYVIEFTKAIAEAPFKKSSEDSLYFSVTAPSDKMSVKVCNDGHGILQLWNQQLQQFYGVRHDTAVAITQVYSSPLALMKAYKDFSVEEGEKLLQDIQVRRGVGVLQTQRRVGIELSKRLYKLFTSTNGDEPLAK